MPQKPINMVEVLGTESDETVPNCLSMPEALAWLARKRIPHKETTPYQIKVGQRISWWPVKGTLFVDGEAKARPEKGRRALIKLLDELKDTL